MLQRLGTPKADLITVPSLASKEAVMRALGMPESRLRVVPHAVDEDYQPLGRDIVDAALERYGLQRGYLFCFASHDPLKNIERLLKAYAGLDATLRREHPLAVVAARPPLRERITNLSDREGVRADVHIVVGATNLDLAALYNGAKALAFPSLAEGFGAPPLEAMACGCPVMTSITAAMPEVAGGAALLVDPYSVDSIQQGIERLLTDTDTADLLRERGFARAKQFSWSNTAEKMLAVYQEVAE